MNEECGTIGNVFFKNIESRFKRFKSKIKKISHKNKIEFDATYYICKEVSADSYDFIKSFYSEDIELAKDNYIIDVDWAKEVISNTL